MTQPSGPSAERGNVEPSAEANGIIDICINAVDEAAGWESRPNSPARSVALVAADDAIRELRALVARLESAASPPPAPRAAGAPTDDDVRRAIRVWNAWPADHPIDDHWIRFDSSAVQMRAVLASMPLYAGAAPPSVAGVSEEMQNDMAVLMRTLGISDHARSASPHEVMVNEIIPAVERLAHG